MTGHAPVPRVVWIITALSFALMVLYATLFPTYRAPDEPEHADLAIHMSRELSYPAYDGLNLSEQTIESMRLARFGHRGLTSEDIEARPDRPAFRDLGMGQEAETPNRMPQHPPLYYTLMGTLLRVANVLGAGALPYDATVWLLRILTAALVSALPVFAFLTTLRLTDSRTAGVTAAVVPLAIPQLTHIGSSVNNDGLLIVLSAGLTVLVARVLRDDWTGRTAVLMGLITGLALITKAFALVFPFWILLLYAIAWRRGLRWQTTLVRIAQVAVVAFIAGGWWWFRNLVMLGRIQASLPAYNDGVDGFITRPFWWLGRFAIWITESFWGWMGWFEAKLPVGLIAAATLIVLVTLFAAVIDPGSRASIGRSEVLFLLSPAVLIGMIVVQRAYAVYADTGITRGIQGRYFLPLVVALAAIVAATWVDFASVRERSVPSTVLGGAAVMQVVALLVVLQTYYGNPDAAIPVRFDAWMAWSPIPAAVAIAAIIIVVGLFAAATLTALADGETTVSIN